MKDNGMMDKHFYIDMALGGLMIGVLYTLTKLPFVSFAAGAIIFMVLDRYHDIKKRGQE